MKTKVAVRHVGDVAVVDVKRKLTWGRVNEYFTELTCQLIDAGEKKILINLQKIRFMDAAGSSGIARCYQCASDNGALVRICGVEGLQEVVQHVLKLLKIVCESEEEAIASFGSGPTGS